MTSQKDIVLGIDLGTTYSAAAYVEDGNPKMIPSEKGYATIPSVVGINRKGQMVVGYAAVDQMVTNPNDTIYGAKRLMGRKYNSLVVSELRDLMTYPIVEGSNGDAAVVLGGKRYDLPEICAFILSEIRDYAEGQLERKISRTVITVPAYYNDNQRQAVKKAGSLAGLTIERIVNEPTAAAITYGFQKKLNQKILIYDFGGGTFDVSILLVRNNEFEVLATGGDNFLGGMDVDQRLTRFAVEKFQEVTKKDLSLEKISIQRLRAAAEQCKRDLSSQTNVELLLPYITSIGGQPVDLQFKVSRDQLNHMSMDLVDRSLTICDSVLASIQMKSKDLDEVVLVGGQTRMPLIRDKVTEHFGKIPRKGVHPEEVVALGAAILGTQGAHSPVILRDVLSIPIGIALPGGKFKTILNRNTPLPTRKSFKVEHKDQEPLVVDIFQGERIRILENEYLGTFHFPPLLKGKKSYPMEMRFELSAECLLTVCVRDLETDKETLTKMVTLQTPDSLRQSAEETLKDSSLPIANRLKTFAKKIIGEKS